MNNPRFAVRFAAVAVWALQVLTSQAVGQDVFREYMYSYGETKGTHFGELDPNTKRVFTGEHAGMAKRKRHVPKPLTLDLEHATRAELSVEYWGGHIGTSGQRFRVNEHDWIDLPQPVGTPTEPQRFYRVLRGNNVVPIPLDQLRDGENIFQFAAGSQIAYSFDWGFYWIYDFTVRVYYDPARKPHSTGRVTSPAKAATFDKTLRLEVEIDTAPIDTAYPTSEVARVEFIGLYDDYDWDGDGVWREWQYTTNHGVLENHLGTATRAPWRVRFDARWLPDQSKPIQVRACITTKRGVTYLTPPIDGLVQRRDARGVRLIKSVTVPEKWASRAGRESPAGTISLKKADLADATFARLAISTWSGDVDDTSVHELRLNGRRLASRFGEFHNYDQDMLEVPVDRLQIGDNTISTYSTFRGHGFEVNWPGPALYIEYNKSPSARE